MNKNNKQFIIFGILVIIFLVILIFILNKYYNEETRKDDSNISLYDEDEVIKLGETSYSLAMKYYWCPFTYVDQSIAYNGTNISYYSEITNYEEVTKVFTNVGLDRFEKYYRVETTTLATLNAITDINKLAPIVKIGKKIYGRSNICLTLKDIYLKTILSISNYSSNKIIYNADRYYYKDNCYNNGVLNANCTDYDINKSQFVLKKDNGSWKIDLFSFPY